MKVLICGSRNLTDEGLIDRALGESGFAPDEILTSDAPGVDEMAARYAAERGIPVKIFGAEWKVHGRRAVALRNVAMIRAADAVIAVSDDRCRETKATVNFSKREGKRLFVLRVEQDERPPAPRADRASL